MLDEGFDFFERFSSAENNPTLPLENHRSMHNIDAHRIPPLPHIAWEEVNFALLVVATFIQVRLEEPMLSCCLLEDSGTAQTAITDQVCTITLRVPLRLKKRLVVRLDGFLHSLEDHFGGFQIGGIFGGKFLNLVTVTLTTLFFKHDSSLLNDFADKLSKKV